MPAIAIFATKVFLWLVTHKEQIKTVILGVEELMPDAAGASKAAAVRNFIAQGIAAEGTIEGDVDKAWPFIGPLFDGFVAKVKKAAGAGQQPVAA
jgi:hypothetical protein